MTKTTMAVALVATALLAATSVAAGNSPVDIAYICDGGTAASARYDVGPHGGVTVAIGGNMLAFSSAPSGSGVRYTTATGPHSIAPLEWWTKGHEATLSELGANGGANRLISTCHAAS